MHAEDRNCNCSNVLGRMAADAALAVADAALAVAVGFPVADAVTVSVPNFYIVSVAVAVAVAVHFSDVFAVAVAVADCSRATIFFSHMIRLIILSSLRFGRSSSVAQYCATH